MRHVRWQACDRPGMRAAQAVHSCKHLVLSMSAGMPSDTERGMHTVQYQKPVDASHVRKNHLLLCASQQIGGCGRSTLSHRPCALQILYLVDTTSNPIPTAQATGNEDVSDLPLPPCQALSSW